MGSGHVGWRLRCQPEEHAPFLQPFAPAACSSSSSSGARQPSASLLSRSSCSAFVAILVGSWAVVKRSRWLKRKTGSAISGYPSTLRPAFHERLLDTEIQAAMQLFPESLRVESAEECSNKSDSALEGDELRGGWLPLFRGSAPYVSMFRNCVMVFHIPGWLLDPSHSKELEAVLGDIALCALLGVQPVLVLSLEHRVMSRMRSELGLEVDLQISPKKPAKALDKAVPQDVSKQAAVLQIFKQEAGWVCEEVERLLRRLGARPGTAGNEESLSVFASSQLFSSSPRWVKGTNHAKLLGQVHAIDVAQIRRRLADQEVVCLIPLGAGAGSEPRYVPSEELAAEVAKALQASKLIFFSRGQRLVDTRRGNVISTLQLRDATRVVEYVRENREQWANDHSMEFYCYLELLVKALQGQTRRGHLIDATRGALLKELYTTDGCGTMVSRDLYDGIRLANSGDVSGILALIEPLTVAGLLKRRSAYEVERACNERELFVWKRDDKTIGCVSLQCFEDAPKQAEVGCFVVSPKCRGKGHGAVLLSYIEQVALLQGLSSLFLLTTQTMGWFLERGFKEGTLADLPPSKRRTYDLGRSSKVYVKDIAALPSEVQQRFTFVEFETLDE